MNWPKPPGKPQPQSPMTGRAPVPVPSAFRPPLPQNRAATVSPPLRSATAQQQIVQRSLMTFVHTLRTQAPKSVQQVVKPVAASVTQKHFGLNPVVTHQSRNAKYFVPRNDTAVPLPSTTTQFSLRDDDGTQYFPSPSIVRTEATKKAGVLAPKPGKVVDGNIASPFRDNGSPGYMAISNGVHLKEVGGVSDYQHKFLSSQIDLFAQTLELLHAMGIKPNAQQLQVLKRIADSKM